MAPKSKSLPGPSRLSGIVAHLNKPPPPVLPSARKLSLKLALKNNHFGARHFLKDDLPRILFANPNVEIEVKRLAWTPQDTWTSELVVEKRDGSSHIIDMDWKWSSAIMVELLNTVGSTSWDRWKAERVSQGLPPLDNADRQPVKRTWLPQEQYLAIVRSPKKPRTKENSAVLSEEVQADLEKARSGVGAGAILP